ncbi:hypothetical protein QT937_022105 [Xanthomonas campestris pv. campestris]|uniref:hypothetical protein n=1 Tax=Xanthomonas campestris TaxID=339 RepID=UPI0025A1A950|nr:hypothetical protein [Xanthomonas campestris]MDM7697963.1 hypothetical protein [Xanthomonas campestris pv. campestris]
MNSGKTDVCAIVVDPANGRVTEVKNTVLLNQITRDATRIGLSFDKIHEDALLKISEQFAKCSALLMTGLIQAGREEDELRTACGELLFNALNTICAATLLLRGGFVLQPGIILRSSFESLAVILHLVQNQNDLPSYKADNFKSSSAIKSAKVVFPPFGHMYGFYSDEFSHIGKLHKQLTPIREYSESNEQLKLNLHFISSAVWMAYVTCELLFLDIINRPRYWSRVETNLENREAYQYSPSEKEISWARDFTNF